MPNESTDRTSTERQTFGDSLAQATLEDKVILWVIVLGFVGGSVLHLAFRAPAILVSVLIASAVAALVYRFLGGIPAETTFAMGGLKLGGSLAALVGVAFLVNHALELQSTSRLVVEGTFKDLVREGDSDADGGNRPANLLVHSLEPVDRQMRLYAQKAYDDSDLRRYDLEWALIARPATDLLKWEFQQRYRVPVSTEVLDPFAPLQTEEDTLRRILLIPLGLLNGRLDRILTVRYMESSDDPYREVGRFVSDLTSPPTELSWENDGTAIADLRSASGPNSPDRPFRLASGLLTRAAWAETMRRASPFEALDDPESRRSVQNFLGSPDLKQQLVARDRLVALGFDALTFIERSLDEPSKDSYDRGVLLQNFAQIVQTLAERGVAVPSTLYADLATELYLQGAYGDAAALFERVSESDDPLFHLRRGVAFYQTNRFQDAVREFQRSVELGEDGQVLAASWRNLGAAYEKSGELERALEAFRAAAVLAPTDELARTKVGELGAQLGNPETESSFWVLVGVWRPQIGFEREHFNVSEPPDPGDWIRAIESVHKRADAPSRDNGWREGPPVGVVAPGELLHVLTVRRSGGEDERIWARAVSGPG